MLVLWDGTVCLISSGLLLSLVSPASFLASPGCIQPSQKEKISPPPSGAALPPKREKQRKLNLSQLGERKCCQHPKRMRRAEEIPSHHTQWLWLPANRHCPPHHLQAAPAAPIPRALCSHQGKRAWKNLNCTALSPSGQVNQNKKKQGEFPHSQGKFSLSLEN